MADPKESIVDTFLPAFVRASSAWTRWCALPPTARGVAVVVSFAALIFLPFLGSVGLWDPWEPHYAEVARSMIAREDYVHPYWEHAYFFSKPVLSMWMMAAGMNLIGALDGPGGAMSIYTEWVVRLPFALTAILGVVMAYLAGARIWSRRVGGLAAFALATMPLYFLVARQAVTDMPFVALGTSALFCFMIAVFGREGDEAPSAGWLYAFYALAGFATLAKGLLGVALPGAVILAWVIASGQWRLLRRLRIPTGVALGLAIAAPWFLVMSLFGGKDDEFKTFAYRFWIHDHFKRLAAGVHTTTPGGTFTYFIEQLGFGTFPWAAAVPGGFAVAALDLAKPAKDHRRSATLFVILWVMVGYVLFSLSATKFHHYCFPMLPPLAILCAWFLDRLWGDEDRKHLVVLVVGIALFVVIAQNFVLQPKHLVDLFVYNYGRSYPLRELDPRPLLAVAFSIAGAGMVAAFLWRSRRFLYGSFLGLAFAFAIWTSWFHWTALSFHWSQRDIFWTYYQERQGDEPVAAYYMNWRGETFYSQNTVKQIKNASDLREFVKPPGVEYVVVEQGRYKGMKSVLSRHELRIVNRSNHKYYLVRVEEEQL